MALTLAERVALKKQSEAIQQKQLQEVVVEEVVVETVKESVSELIEQVAEVYNDALVIEDESLGIMDATILNDAELTTADIVPRIRQLNSLSDMQVEGEMALLKSALLANPQAVSLMLPEDVGLLVEALRRITKEAILADANAKALKTTKTKVPKINTLTMTKEQMLDITDF